MAGRISPRVTRRRRAQEALAQTPGQPPAGAQPESNVFGQGVSGIAIDDEDRIYVFNRGVQTVLVFDRDGKFVKGGGEKDLQGRPIMGGWLHSGKVDWEGNVWASSGTISAS